MKRCAPSLVVLALAGCSSGRTLRTPEQFVEHPRSHLPEMRRGAPADEDELRGSLPPPLPQRPWPRLAASETRLASGVRVATVARREFPTVACTFALDRGAADVPPAAARLYSTTIRGSSADHDRQEAHRYLDYVGARVATTVSYGGTFLRVSAMTPLFVSALSRAAPMFLAPLLASEDLERTRALLVAQHQEEDDEPRPLAEATLAAALFPSGHPYATPIDGASVESAEKVLPKVVAQLRDLHLSPEHVIVACAGDLEHERMVRVLTPYLARLTKKPDRPRIDVSAPPAVERPGIVVVDRPGAVQANVALGWIVPEATSPELPAIEILATACGVGLSSRLNLTARRELGATYGVHASVSRRRGASVVSLQAAIDNARVGPTLAGMLRELERLGTEPLAPDELASAKLRAASRLVDTSSEGLADALAQALTLGGSPADVLAAGARLESASAEQVQAAARWMDPGKARIVIVGDASALEAPLRGLGRPVEVVQRRRSGRP